MEKDTLSKKEVYLIDRYKKYYGSTGYRIKIVLMLLFLVILLFMLIYFFLKSFSENVIDRLFNRNLIYLCSFYIMYACWSLFVDRENKKWLKIIDKLMKC